LQRAQPESLQLQNKESIQFENTLSLLGTNRIRQKGHQYYFIFNHDLIITRVDFGDFASQ
jgi:hypothetical protein